MGAEKGPRLTPELRTEFLEAVAAGVPFSAIAAAFEIGEETVYRWRTWGRKGRAPYAKFLRDMDRARFDAVRERIKHVKDSGKADWRSSAWWLSHVVAEFMPKTRGSVQAEVEAVPGMPAPGQRMVVRLSWDDGAPFVVPGVNSDLELPDDEETEAPAAKPARTKAATRKK